MTGQDAVTVAEKFNEVLDITGVVLTKMDGDARGGAALSIKSITGKPLKFVGMGERSARWKSSIRTASPPVFWAWAMS